MRRPADLHDLVLTPTGLRFGGRIIPCSIGHAGVVTDKREGDGGTPAGVHRVTGLFYRPDRLRRPAPWALPIGPRDLWCDAPADPVYNTHVRAPFGASAEALRRPDPLYDIILTTDWNWPLARPGGGSAIFVHQWRRPGYPTAGCVAMARGDLLALARQLAPGSRLVVPAQLAGRRRRHSSVTPTT